MSPFVNSIFMVIRPKDKKDMTKSPPKHRAGLESMPLKILPRNHYNLNPSYLHIYHSKVVAVYGHHRDVRAMEFHRRNPWPDKDNLQYHVYQTRHIYHRIIVEEASYFHFYK